MSGPAPGGGKVVAWIAFVFGGIVSVAANVLHAWLPPKPPEGAPAGWAPPADWAPSIAAQIGAAIWPLALLLSVEVLSRVAWPTGWQWKLARYGGVGLVGIGSALISYGHLYGVLEAWEYGPLGSAVGPIVIDGLMTISGFALLAGGPRTGPDRNADRNAGTDGQTGLDRNVVHADAEVVRTVAPERTVAELVAGLDHPTTPDRPAGPPTDHTDRAQTVHARTATGPGPDLRRTTRTAPDRTGGPTDAELVERIRELADQTGGRPSERAVRGAVRVGPDRAKRLLDLFDQTGPRRTA